MSNEINKTYLSRLRPASSLAVANLRVIGQVGPTDPYDDAVFISTATRRTYDKPESIEAAKLLASDLAHRIQQNSAVARHAHNVGPEALGLL